MSRHPAHLLLSAAAWLGFVAITVWTMAFLAGVVPGVRDRRRPLADEPVELLEFGVAHGSSRVRLACGQALASPQVQELVGSGFSGGARGGWSGPRAARLADAGTAVVAAATSTSGPTWRPRRHPSSPWEEPGDQASQPRWDGCWPHALMGRPSLRAVNHAAESRQAEP